MKKNWFVLPVAVLLIAGLLAGCGGDAGSTGSGTGGADTSTSSGGGDAPSGDAPDTIKIGCVNPTTGVLAGFGEGTPWVENHIIDYVNDELGGIYIEEYDQKIPVELILYDTESNETKVGEFTQKLIEEDKVDIMLTRHTPETINPSLAVCERYEMPCVATDAPVEAVLGAAPEGGYKWSFHSHWDLETIYKCYESMWTTAGFAPDSGTIIGLFFANDADGVAWNTMFTTNPVESGYEVVDPGMFPAGTQDFSELINQYKERNVQILSGSATNSDFGNLWRQCKQMGFEPELVTMGKAYLLQSDADAIGADLMDGLCGEVWWSATHPWKSSLTGETPADVAKIYNEETDRRITTPMGAKYYGVEIAIDALTRAASLDKEKIRDAIAATDLETIFGHVKYEEDHAWRSSLTGGQWQVNDGELELIIFDNTLFPNIDTTGEFKPLDQ